MSSKNATEKTANEFVNVRDIKDIFLYTKDSIIFCYLRIYPFNLDLLPTVDRKALTNRIAAQFDGDRKNFAYESYPRELDLDEYKNYLKQKRMECLEHMGRKNIIDILIRQATDLSSGNENYEHQQFFKIWAEAHEKQASVEADLRERINNLRNIYLQAQIKSEVLKEREIIKLCNLYGNRRSAVFDVAENRVQAEIPLLRG